MIVFLISNCDCAHTSVDKRSYLRSFTCVNNRTNSYDGKDSISGCRSMIRTSMSLIWSLSLGRISRLASDKLKLY